MIRDLKERKVSCKLTHPILFARHCDKFWTGGSHAAGKMLALQVDRQDVHKIKIELSLKSCERGSKHDHAYY